MLLLLLVTLCEVQVECLSSSFFLLLVCPGLIDPNTMISGIHATRTTLENRKTQGSWYCLSCLSLFFFFFLFQWTGGRSGMSSFPPCGALVGRLCCVALLTFPDLCRGPRKLRASSSRLSCRRAVLQGPHHTECIDSRSCALLSFTRRDKVPSFSSKSSLLLVFENR